MNFYLDFEATQFSHRIISIGCVADNQKTFKSYVNPGEIKDRTTKFITDLTGITDEMLAAAPSADTAFANLFDFIYENNDESAPVFYCYGDGDKEFLGRTIKTLSDAKAYMCALTIQRTIIDYQFAVKKFFKAKDSIGLKKVYNLIQSESSPQSHDALEDAYMLYTVKNSLAEKCSPADKAVIDAMPSNRVSIPKADRAPEIFISWDGSKAWDVNTDADETNWAYKATTGPHHTLYFKSIDTLALWIMRFFTKKRSPKKEEDIQYCVKLIENAFKNNKRLYGMTLEKKGE